MGEAAAKEAAGVEKARVGTGVSRSRVRKVGGGWEGGCCLEQERAVMMRKQDMNEGNDLFMALILYPSFPNPLLKTDNENRPEKLFLPPRRQDAKKGRNRTLDLQCFFVLGRSWRLGVLALIRDLLWSLNVFGFFVLLAFLGPVSPGGAQTTAPYLTSATLYISVDDWADIWLNDIQIVDSLPRTPESKGFQTIQCVPQHLCYFQRENLLAIENADAYKIPQPLDDRVGIAYVLRLRLSNGTELTLSSNDLAEHRANYLPDRMQPEPRGWRKPAFDDGTWPEAESTGTVVPDLAQLFDPETHLPAQFLSATGTDSKARFPGERHLYRRKIFLDIGSNPDCGATPAAAFLPSPTPAPPAAFEERHPPLPTPVYPGWPAPTPTAVLPSPIRTVIAQSRKKVKPTPTFPFVPQVTAEPFEAQAPAAPVKALIAPTASFTVAVAAEESQTIVFGKPPANIYISFADGPGVYQLEIFDSALHPLRNLFEKKVVAQDDAWVEWDGKDDQGRDVPLGPYLAVYSKDGRELNKIMVLRSADP